MMPHVFIYLLVFLFFIIDWIRNQIYWKYILLIAVVVLLSLVVVVTKTAESFISNVHLVLSFYCRNYNYDKHTAGTFTKASEDSHLKAASAMKTNNQTRPSHSPRYGRRFQQREIPRAVLPDVKVVEYLRQLVCSRRFLFAWTPWEVKGVVCTGSPMLFG